jgi:cleavage stimulation factor subunit 2
MQGGYGMPMQHQMPSMQMNYGVQQAPAMGSLGAGTSGPVPYDAIASVLNTMNPNELLNVLSDMKDQIEKDPEQAKDFLQKNPQLCNALFQACIILKVVNPNVVQRVVQKIQESAMQQPPTQPIQPAAPMMGYGNVPPPGAGPMLPDLSHIPEPQRVIYLSVLTC